MKSAAAFLLAALVSAINAHNIPRATTSYTCAPGQPCWPTDAQFAAFNSSIGGRLVKTVPWASPCFASPGPYNAAACAQVQNGYLDEYNRSSIYGAMENLNWEACGTKDCLLQSLLPQTPTVGRTCSLGRLSLYYVDARSPDDVSKTLQFVAQHQIFLQVKNTGHDYLGRSGSTPNSIAIWTHNMNTLAFNATFTAYNCPASNGQNVGTMGAGTAAIDAYYYFQSKGMNVVGGAYGSVGLAGGFGQGGGHGAFGPSRGLAVDSAIEFDVVKADGSIATINSCNDPDLFYAMRGGGGGTYAILTAYKTQLYPMVDMNIYSFKANFSIPADIASSKVLTDFITQLAQNQPNWGTNNISGYNFYYPNNLESYQILPANNSLSTLQNLTKSYHDFATSYPGITITQNDYRTFKLYTDYLTYTTPIGHRNTPVGYAERLSGRLIPKTLFATPASISTLVQAFLAGMKISFNPTNLVKPVASQIYATGPANYDDPEGHSGVNPAWRGSLWETVFSGGWTQGTPQAVQDYISQSVDAAMDPLRSLTPGGGCYMNEASTLEKDWQTAFFGSNYNRLLSIKNRYDPTGLFSCYKCVGWTNTTNYACYAASSNPAGVTLP